jgi:hypothetical protein
MGVQILTVKLNNTFPWNHSHRSEVVAGILHLENVFTIHEPKEVDDGKKYLYLVQTYHSIWKDVKTCLKAGKDAVMIILTEYYAENGHAMVLYISSSQKTIEILDPGAQIENYLIKYDEEEIIFGAVEFLLEDDSYKRVSLRNLQLECPNVIIAPQTKQVLEKFGFSGSCFMWSLWLMSLRARHVNVKDIMSLKLKDIENEYGSLTRFIRQFAIFFKDNEDLFNNPKKLAKKMLKNDTVFTNMCIYCSEKANFKCSSTGYLYCGKECQFNLIKII